MIKMTVNQKVVAKVEIIFQHNIPMLDVMYHICVAQEHDMKVEVSPKSPSPSPFVPIFG